MNKEDAKILMDNISEMGRLIEQSEAILKIPKTPMPHEIKIIADFNPIESSPFLWLSMEAIAAARNLMNEKAKGKAAQELIDQYGRIIALQEKLQMKLKQNYTQLQAEHGSVSEKTKELKAENARLLSTLEEMNSLIMKVSRAMPR